MDTFIYKWLTDPYVSVAALLDIENVDGHKIFLPKEEALSYFEKRTVAKWDISGPGYQGIVCECCYNRCDIMELKQYCAQPKLYGGGKRTRPERARRRRYRARTAQQHSLRRRYEMQRDAGEKLEQPNSITLGGGVEQRAEEIRNKMVGVPVEVPVEISVEVPEEAPIKTRVQVPIEAPVEVPVEAPLEVVAVPMEAPEKDMNHHAMVEERPVITGIRLESKPRITRNKLYGAVTRKLSQQTTVDSKHKPSHMIIAVGDWRDDV